MDFEKNIRDQRQRQQDEIAKSCDQGNDIEKARKAFPDGYTKTDKKGVKWKKEAGKWVRQKKGSGGSEKKEESVTAKVDDKVTFIPRGFTGVSRAQKHNHREGTVTHVYPDGRMDIKNEKDFIAQYSPSEVMSINGKETSDPKPDKKSKEEPKADSDLKPKHDLSGKDLEVYNSVIKLYKEGKISQANTEIDDYKEKGAIRDALPTKVLKDLGYSLTSKGKKELKSKSDKTGQIEVGKMYAMRDGNGKIKGFYSIESIEGGQVKGKTRGTSKVQRSETFQFPEKYLERSYKGRLKEIKQLPGGHFW